MWSEVMCERIQFPETMSKHVLTERYCHDDGLNATDARLNIQIEF